MGGHAGGDYASRLAVKTIEETILAFSDESEATLSDDVTIEPNDYRGHLRESILSASRKIYFEANSNPTLKGMGTTSVVMLVRGEKVFFANVGDSRGYLIRDGNISQLTIDHSLVGEQLRAGVISEVAARGHRLKNIITRSVGFQEDVEIDILAKLPKEGDRYLLCSDGLSNMLSDEELLEVVKDNDLKEACHVLVDMANARGGEDNITVILSEVTEVPEIDNEEDSSDESTIGI